MLVDAVASQETQEFGDFWDWGWRYARRLLGNECDGEDVVQDAICRLIAKRQKEDWNPPANERAAIFAKVVRNLCIDKLRRTKPLSNADAEQWFDRKASAEDAAIARETRQQLGAAIDRLSDNWRGALLLRASGLPYEEISQVMRVTKAQVRTWIFRARQQLISELKLEGGQ
jgi:RNA polymerase sigma-70 factor (ECF subfamily)